MPPDPFFVDRYAGTEFATWADVMAGDPKATEALASLSAGTATSWVLPDVEVVDTEAPAPDGPVAVRVYRPAGHDPGEPLPGFVWVHGGAFMFGDLDMLEAHAVAAEIASRLPAVVVSVGYRLAPAVHFPVPVDECVAAFTWASAHHAELGIDPASLSLGGASAGGNLAAATALRLRDEGGPTPASLVLAYPSLHHDPPPAGPEVAAAVEQVAPLARLEDFLVRDMYATYLGHRPEGDVSPYLAPALADVTGLPPTLVIVAEHDTLRTSGEVFAALLTDAGVPAELRLEAGMAHGHLNHVTDVAGADASIDAMVAHLRAASR